MTDGQRDDSPSVVDIFREWYHVPALVAVSIVMLWMRLQRFDAFTVDGTVYFDGNDAWYHLRQVNYTVQHWPFTMPFDPWTYFPYGTNAGQFGTIYDQLIATAALVVGLGSPTEQTVATTLLVAPAVFGALAVFPTYYIGSRLGGRIAGLFGAVVLMLLPGSFLRRTLVGFADHNAAEPFFMAVAVAAFMVALAVVETDRPIWELVEERDFDPLRRSALWSVVAGVAFAAYLYAWPPGVLLVGIVGIFLLLKLTSDFLNDQSPDYVAFAGVVAMTTTALLMVVPYDTPDFRVTDYSFLQILFPLAVAAGAAFLAGLARVWESRDLDVRGYPAAVFASVLVALGVFAVVAPGAFETVVFNLQRTVGFSAGAETRTIAEAQPFLDPGTLRSQGYVDANGNPNRVGRILSEYGFAFFTGVVAAIVLAAKPLFEDDEDRHTLFVGGGLAVVGLVYLVPSVPAGIAGALGVVPEVVGIVVVAALVVAATFMTRYEAERLFVLVWAAIITSAAFTQVRFNYYLAVVVASMNAYLLGEVLAYFDLRSVPERLGDIDVDAYQLMVIGAVVILILTPALLVPINVRTTGNPAFDKNPTAWQSANSTSPGSVTQWDGSLQWLSENTPAEGTMGGADNEMEYYGTYQQTDDFEYPEGAYGVMSWWDYGHWITVRGERIPNANPFQQGAESAANFLLAPNEEQAETVLESQSTEGDQTRYVMVDWQMATPGSKFGAPTVWYDYNDTDLESSEFYERVYSQNYRSSFLVRHQRYYDSQMVRLYEYHGSAVEPQPIVIDWEVRQAQTQSGQTVTVNAAPAGENNTLVRQFDNMSAAREYVEQDETSQIGGVGPYPSERVPALEHYRLVKVSESSAYTASAYARQVQRTSQATGIPPRFLSQSNPAWVKTFERVPGATIEGEGARPNTTVRASVTMRVSTTNETFTYIQQTQSDENGEFTMTLPYATTGYDEYGPENGYTNVSVRADGPYTVETPGQVRGTTVTASVANVSVEEGRVNGDVAAPKQVTLQRQQRNITLSGSSTASGSDGSGSDSGTGDSSSSDLTAPSTLEATAVDPRV
jgi:dolichyl-diphosphooligosaccharide--protein glycosyltransferase